MNPPVANSDNLLINHIDELTPSMITGWRMVDDIGAATRLDNTHFPYLKKIGEVIDNPNLLARLKGADDADGLEGLKKIVIANGDLSFVGCPKPPCNFTYMLTKEELMTKLNELHIFYPTNNLNGNKFFNTIKGRLKFPANASRRGTLFEMNRTLARNQPTAEIGNTIRTNPTH